MSSVTYGLAGQFYLGAVRLGDRVVSYLCASDCDVATVLQRFAPTRTRASRMSWAVR